jgi:hypothetical protein
MRRTQLSLEVRNVFRLGVESLNNYMLDLENDAQEDRCETWKPGCFLEIRTYGTLSNTCLFFCRYNPLWLYFPQPSSGL